jgi:hypothetical protein
MQMFAHHNYWKKVAIFIIKILDLILLPFTFLSALLLYSIRKIGLMDMTRFKMSLKIFKYIGMIPVINHYYEPYYANKNNLRTNRELAGIDFNISEQLSILRSFNYSDELKRIPIEKPDNLKFYYKNDSFPPGDSEYWYSIIRKYKPKIIIEIGSGNSTLMAKTAILENKKNDNTYCCEHVCIEPFEAHYLDNIDVKVIRKKVENINLDVFSRLLKNDILFIDSSHIIKPKGDVLFEYFEIIPQLNSGVIIHIHDIFTPKEYLNSYYDNFWLWNEQYLLEAFLQFNDKFRIIGALNYLKNKYPDLLKEKFPIFQKYGGEPGSFYLIKN